MQKKKKRLQISNKIKLSSTVRMTLVLFAVVLFAFNSGRLIMNLSSKTEEISEKKELYSYKNKFSEDFHINIKDNEYVKEDEILEGQTYISDLVSTIDFNMNYQYKDSKPTDIEYSYKIETIIKAEYSNAQGAYDVLNKKEVIKEENKLKGNSKNLKIEENVTIDYAKYHQTIKSFRQEMALNLDAFLYVRLTVNTKAKVDKQNVENNYVSDFKISLGDKIALVEDNSKPETSDSIVDETTSNRLAKVNVKAIIINTIFMIIGIVIFKEVLTKTEKLNTIKNEYKLELNRILKSCENKLIQIEDLKQIDIENATRVKDIYQLLKLSDEALVPIYCYIKDEPDNVAYFIVNKYEKSYIYILRKS